MLRCDGCGTAMRPRTYRHRGDSGVYLCLTKERDKTCETTPVKRELVDAAVLGFFENIGLDVETRNGLAAGSRRQVAEARPLREGAEADPQRLDEQAARIRRDYRAGELAAALTELELAGAVTHEEGVYRACS